MSLVSGRASAKTFTSLLMKASQLSLVLVKPRADGIRQRQTTSLDGRPC